MFDVTRLLSAIEVGDPTAAAELLPLVYDELRKLAVARMAAEKPGQTLQATALVHEAYLRLVGSETTPPWNSRGHFFAAAAESMRRILVESARRKGRQKFGGGRQRVALDEVATLAPDNGVDDVLALDEALTALAQVEPEKAAIVHLRYFAGLTLKEVAACRGLSPATVKRHWAVARAWLYDALTAEPAAKNVANS